MELGSGKLGPETDFEVQVKDGNLIVSSQTATPGVSVNLAVGVKADYFLDKLAALIPGTFDDAVIALAKQALKNLG